MNIKIGVTEGGDPSFNFGWVDYLKKVDGGIIITKNLTDAVIKEATPFFDKLIFHITCTGYGGTKVEPHTPKPMAQLKQTNKLVAAGFPKERIIIRVDPVIPTEKGIERAKDIINLFAAVGYKRFRVSAIDMYPHVRERFAKAGLPLPYGNNFAPSKNQLQEFDGMLGHIKEIYPDIRVTCCAEPMLKNAEQEGCVSERDAKDLGLNPSAMGEGKGYQRKGCLCCSCKVEMLAGKQQCPYGCLYCYWK